MSPAPKSARYSQRASSGYMCLGCKFCALSAKIRPFMPPAQKSARYSQRASSGHLCLGCKFCALSAKIRPFMPPAQKSARYSQRASSGHLCLGCKFCALSVTAFGAETSGLSKNVAVKGINDFLFPALTFESQLNQMIKQLFIFDADRLP